MKENSLILKVFGASIYLILSIWLMSFCFDMINAKSTIENIAGLIILLADGAATTFIIKSIFNNSKPKKNENEN